MTDDLISRADAIEALEKAKERYFDRAVIIARMQDILRAIPSAQPKIVRCKDCRHYNSMTNGCKRNPSVESWGDNDFCSYGEKMEVENEDR